jgi:hypothetical protein
MRSRPQHDARTVQIFCIAAFAIGRKSASIFSRRETVPIK